MSVERTLLLARHAKSSWSEVGLPDFERPLNERGQRDLPQMADRLRARGLIMERALSSPAVRARSTAEQLAPAMGVAVGDIEIVPEIYEASWKQLRDVLRARGRDAISMLVVGHNPGMTELVNLLADAKIHSLPTCGLVELRFDLDDWADLDSGQGELMDFDYPKRQD